MAKLTEKRCNAIAEAVDGFSEDEQKFILWYLLGGAINGLEKEVENFHEKAEKNITKIDLYGHFKMCDHLHCLEEFREITGLDIWG